jgi:hypothetical protein
MDESIEKEISRLESVIKENQCTIDTIKKLVEKIPDLVISHYRSGGIRFSAKSINSIASAPEYSADYLPEHYYNSPFQNREYILHPYIKVDGYRISTIPNEFFIGYYNPCRGEYDYFEADIKGLEENNINPDVVSMIKRKQELDSNTRLEHKDEYNE